MANDQVVRDPNQCQEKQALIDQIRISINRVVSIHNEELDVAISGDFCQTGDLFASRLREARESRVSLIEKLGRHVSEHGC